MRKRLQYSSHESQARESSIQSRGLSRRDQELSRKIEELENLSPSVRNSLLLDEALVITGSQEKKLMAVKRMQPLVKIPEVNMRVGPFEQDSGTYYDY